MRSENPQTACIFAGCHGSVTEATYVGGIVPDDCPAMSVENSVVPRLSFGVIADPQYADLPPNVGMGRYYANSLQKLGEAIDRFNQEDLAFVITLGDLIDRDWAHFDTILPLYQNSRHECIFLPGNHDFAVAPEHLAGVYAKLGMPAPYHDIARGGCRFIIIDGSEISLFAPPVGDPRRADAARRIEVMKVAGEANANPWNGGIGGTQQAWLSERLAQAKAAGETAIVLGHYPLYPPNDHNLWDDAVVAGLLAEAGAAAYLCGHNHAGNYGRLGSTHFVNFCGMVDTETENTYAIVDVYSDRLEIRGFGREPSRVLAL